MQVGKWAQTQDQLGLQLWSRVGLVVERSYTLSPTQLQIDPLLSIEFLKLNELG